MITRAEIEKLGALHVVEPAMLSPYLAVPPSADLAARAGELIAAAEAACGQPMAEQGRTWVLERLPPCARDWPGRTVAVPAGRGRVRPEEARGHPAARQGRRDARWLPFRRSGQGHVTVDHYYLGADPNVAWCRDGRSTARRAGHAPPNG